MVKMLDDFTVNAQYTEEFLKQNPDLMRFIEQTGRQVAYSNNYKGQKIIVAVMDTGTSPHPALGSRLLPGKNMITNYPNTKTIDDNGHGTHTAGLVAGAIWGLAPLVEILPVKVLAGDGGGEWSDMVKALDWIRNFKTGDGRQVSVINMSLSGGERDINETEKAALDAALQRCWDADILPVSSMGNSGIDEKRYPACSQWVCAVGAVDRTKMQAMFATRGNHCDVTQNGVDIISLCNDGGYISMSGTSMSTPIVSGIAALLACEYMVRNKGERISASKLYDAVKAHTRDIGITGTDSTFGAGFCTLQGLNLTLKVEHGSKIAYINGVKYEMKRPVEMLDGYTTMTVRDLVEAMGGDIKWYPQTGEHNTQAEFIL